MYVPGAQFRFWPIATRLHPAAFGARPNAGGTLALIVGLLLSVALAFGAPATPTVAQSDTYPGPPIGGISGRMIDATTGQPIVARPDRWAHVRLDQCSWANSSACVWVKKTIEPDAAGGFSFTTDSSGAPLDPGYYRVVAMAQGHATIESDVFTIGSGEHVNIGDLSLTPTPTINAIVGRAVDGKTGQPMASAIDNATFVSLYRCSDYGCYDSVAAQPTGADGRFRFDVNGYNQPLAPGTYFVQLTANRYEPASVGPFTVGENEYNDLGDVRVMPFTYIGSISGRIVDGVTGKPLAGDREPYTNVYLYRCEEYNGVSCSYSSSSGYQQADANGRFHFDSTGLYEPLRTGTYGIIVQASQYYPSSFSLFTVGEDEHKDIGDQRLQSFPVRITEIKPCQALPSTGGMCRFSLRITNGLTTTLNGANWSIVTATSSPFVNSSIFQTGIPMPFRLAPGAGRTIDFSFRVPAGVPENASFCAETFVSKDLSTWLYNIVGRRQLFCTWKQANQPYRVMSPDEMRTFLNRGIRIPGIRGHRQ